MISDVMISCNKRHQEDVFQSQPASWQRTKRVVATSSSAPSLQGCPRCCLASCNECQSCVHSCFKHLQAMNSEPLDSESASKTNRLLICSQPKTTSFPCFSLQRPFGISLLLNASGLIRCLRPSGTFHFTLEVLSEILP